MLSSGIGSIRFVLFYFFRDLVHSQREFLLNVRDFPEVYPFAFEGQTGFLLFFFREVNRYLIARYGPPGFPKP